MLLTLLSADFFQNQFFGKILSGVLFQNKTHGGGGGGGVRHIKCILSFREDKTKVKIQLVDLFHRKQMFIPDSCKYSCPSL